MAHDVFISYSHFDKAIADTLCEAIEKTGVRCWIAPRDIAPGQDWPEAISNAIVLSRIMLLVFSAHSNASRDVSRELVLASNSNLIIIPFKIAAIEPEPGKQYYLARTHWFEAGDPPTQTQIEALSRHVKSFLADQAIPEAVSPVPQVKPARHNLPAQLTSFIGRTKEMDEVRKLVAENRLVTLVGPGGTGKTRLSLQVAGDLLDQYPDGVWLVELAPLAQPDLLPATIIAVLKIREEPGHSILDSLTDYLRSKKTLMVLDNCEHLVEACAQVSEELLRACPELHILASSREALNIAGEMVFHVPALSLPAAGGLTSSETLLQYESVRLFTERAAVARSGFSLTSQNGPAVAQICRRLDGIPLALELAAARMKVLTAEQIAARLDDRFRLLVGGSRTALPRQQTLKTMIDWSYDLLSESEQVLLQRLSIFAGGWTLEAAEQVTGVEPLEPPAILDLLTQLVSKSLVTVDEHTGEARYHMLETILQYGREKLRTAGEQDMMNDRHLGYFVELAEKADLYIRGAEEKLWLDYLEAELDNLRQALSWVFERQNVPACLRLAGILPRFWQLRSYFIEGLESSEKMLALEAAIVIPAPPDSLIVVKARGLMEIAIFWQTAWLRMLSVDLNRSFELSKASLAIYQQLGDQRGQAAALRTIAQYSMDTNNIEEAQAAAKESLALAKAADDKWLMAEVLNNILGNCEDFLGDYKRANEYHAQGLALRKEIGDKDGAAWALLLLGMGELYQERYAQASKYLEEALQFSHAVGNTYITGTILCKLGPAAMGLGNLQAAGQFLTEGLKLNLTTNEKSYSLLCLNELGGLAGAQKQWERSARLLGFVSKQLEGVLPLLVGPGVHDRYVAAARAYMHETTFNAAWDAGQTMSLDEACAFALEETVS